MPPSVRSRFTATVIANILRGGLGFITGLLVARGLGPEQYGNYIFLLGSFLALGRLFDLGTSGAFYTFISQRPRAIPFLLSYISWKGFQFIIMVIAIGLLPLTWLNKIWLGLDRGLILLSFAAVFLQQQAWQTLTQIGEASRMTQRVQGMNIGISVVYLLLIFIFWKLQALSIYLIFSLIIVEYIFALFFSYSLIWSKREQNVLDSDKSPFVFREMLKEYSIYCAPLLVYSVIGFFYEFADRWMLQNYSGSVEQGYYSIGSQFATISLLATTSILQIFWKEIAEAHERQDVERVKMLYSKVSRSLFMLGAIISGFLIPWSKEIINVTLGTAYAAAVPALAIMFLYPVHQSIGQIVGTMYFAIGKTRPYSIIGVVFMLISIPVTYFVIAPTEAFIPGLALGSTGMAIKMVILQLIGVDISAWWLSRIYGWKFDWIFQVIGLGGAVLLGWLAYEVVKIMTFGMQLTLFLRGGISFVLYCFLIAGMIWAMPWLLGTERREIMRTIRRRFG
ncbi:Polysaccharide biosynthesis protein [uncultured archaeon]|nr:Polysaccharide biosynthesis protein [uncultured archaeon]